ncbi:MAG: SDR family oxidoreductase [candidate division KSB1 bacterium]|nr:SDR family oxidoreductase [candidate division KSB1 bacterium]
MTPTLFLVTGGGGFIGSNIVEELLRLGHRVRVLDNFSTGRRENLTPFLNDIELFEGDIRSYHTVHQAVKGVDIILHQAALPSVPRSIHDPITSNDVNVGGTLNLLEAAKDHGVRRVVFASSSSIYGDTPELPKHEGMTPKPLSPYAVSKLTGEHYCRVFSQVYGLETISLRYFNVFGPRQNPFSQYAAVIPKFIHAMLRGERPVIYGDGEQSRDFTYVANVVQANLAAATMPWQEPLVMNCAAHGRITLNELVRALQKLLNNKIEPIYQDSRPGDIRHSFADISLAKEKLGYTPTIDFYEGLRRTIAAFLEKPVNVKSI